MEILKAIAASILVTIACLAFLIACAIGDGHHTIDVDETILFEDHVNYYETVERDEYYW